MTLKRLGFTSLFLAVLAVPGYWVLAGDEGKPSTGKQPQPDKVQKDGDRTSANDGRSEAKPEEKHARPDDKPPRCLGKTVKLEFKLVNPDDEQVLTILCATDDFAMSRKLSDTNGAQGCEVSGTLTKADDQGRFLLVFKANLHHLDSKEAVEATFTAKGSAILEIGTSKTLTVLGPSPLKVTATLGD